MKRALLSFLFLFALLSFPQIVLAHSTVTPPPGWQGSYKVVSSDGQYVLVMLDGVYKPPNYNTSPEIDEQNKLLLKYPASGLYKNDGSNKPLWVIQYISWYANINISGDGHHLVLIGEGLDYGDSYGKTGLVFFEDGHLLAGYNMVDLVIDPGNFRDLPYSAGTYRWQSSYSLDDAVGILSLETYSHEKYIFSLHTGKVVSAVIPTATPKHKSNRRSGIAASSVATTASTPLPNATSFAAYNQQDITAMSILVSAGSLTTIVAGVNFLSARARRKAASVYSSHSQFHVRKVTLDPARYVRKRHGHKPLSDAQQAP